MSKIEDLGVFGLRFYQPDHLPHFGTDSILLADFAALRLRNGMRVMDLCCGSGILSCLMAARKKIELTGVEIEETAVQAALTNLKLNNLSGTILHTDLRKLSPNAVHDLVIANPPYFDASSPASPDPKRFLARSDADCPFDMLAKIVSQQVKFGGYFFMCYPPARLTEAVYSLHSAGLEPKRLRPVAYTVGKSPFVLLIETKKGAAPGLTFAPTLYMTDPEIKEIYAGRY